MRNQVPRSVIVKISAASWTEYGRRQRSIHRDSEGVCLHEVGVNLVEFCGHDQGRGLMVGEGGLLFLALIPIALYLIVHSVYAY